MTALLAALVLTTLPCEIVVAGGVPTLTDPACVDLVAPFTRGWQFRTQARRAPDAARPLDWASVSPETQSGKLWINRQSGPSMLMPEAQPLAGWTVTATAYDAAGVSLGAVPVVQASDYGWELVIPKRVLLPGRRAVLVAVRATDGLSDLRTDALLITGTTP